jgi:hypothetical protein
VEITEKCKISQQTTNNLLSSTSSAIHIHHWDLHRGTAKTRAKTSRRYPCTKDSRGLGSNNTGEYNHCYRRIGDLWSGIPQLRGRNRRLIHTSGRWRNGRWLSISYTIVQVRARGLGNGPCSPWNYQQMRPHQHSVSYVSV